MIGRTVHAKLVRYDYDGAYITLMEHQQQQQQSTNIMMTTLPTALSNSSSSLYIPITTLYILQKQFQHILSSYTTTTTAIKHSNNSNYDNDDNIASTSAKECLRRIANAIVITGGKSKKEVECMCNTARYLLSWPMILTTTTKTMTNNNTSPIQECITVKNVRVALSTMSIAIAGVVNVICSDDGGGPTKNNKISSSNNNNEQVMSLEECRHLLNERCTALKVLSIILPSLIDVKVSINDPYLAVSSIQELLYLLVERGAFKLVQKLLRTTIKVNMQQQGSSSSSSTSTVRMVSSLLHPDIIAMSVMRIPLTLHPRIFIPWLCDVVIPSLSVGSKTLQQIHSWSVNAACYYDDDENNVSKSSEGDGGGIDASVMLLSAVNDATARLTVAMNSNNFIYHSQHQQADQDATDVDNNDLTTPRNNSHDGSFSFNSTVSCKSRSSSSSSRPTVLNIGLISGAKNTSGSRMMSAQRIGRGNSNKCGVVGITKSASLDYSFLNKLLLSPDSNIETSFVNVNDDDDDDDDDRSLDYDCVEYKLNEAIRLKKARDLGLSKTVLRLTTYSIKGEQYIMKELVKSALLHHYSDDSCDDETTRTASSIVVDQIRSFAATLDANFDEAIRQYATELCDNNRDDIPQALRRTRILFHWCSSPAIKCDIVLRMLRVALVSVQCPPDITLLAKDAIAMAVDETDKSELQEALKLLEIDSLVRNYCGNEAQEYFRVVSVLGIVVVYLF